MKRALAALMLIALTATAVRAQSLKHEKYALPNGLTVILHEDHSLPRASINLWYRVGARNEPPGRSGFAHLYEHLMFMGTRRVPGNDFDILMETGGGANNASTSLDRTNYFSAGPASLLPTLLWLDADRMEDMGPMMDQEKLNKQRDIVRNEIRQNVENAPYGRAYEYSYKYLYPVGHPYHMGVYGTHEDLEAAKVIDVKDFFATFYAPNNCSLVVAGDFNTDEIKKLIADQFGSIPRGNVAPQAVVPPVKMDRVVRVTMLDKVQLPKIALTYHSPASYADGDAEVTLASMILADGKSSRLYRRLVEKDQTCVEVAAYQDGGALGSLLRVEVMAKPEADLTAVERAVDEELALLCDKGPTNEELSQRQAVHEAGMLASLQSIEARADRLNEYEYYWGTPDGLKRDLERFSKATTQGVQRVCRAVFTPDARLIIRVLPEQPDRIESPRDKRPSDASAAAFTPPEPATFTLSNGVKVLLWERPSLPLVAMQVLLRPGGAVDATSRAGLSTLTADMLSEGAGERDGPAFAQAMQGLGGSFDAGAGRESFGASLSVIARNFEPAAGLLADAMLRPRFQETDFNRVKSLHLENLHQQEEEPPAVATRVASRMLFGAEHPYGRTLDGDIETVEPLTLADVKGHWNALARPEHATILLAGAVSVEAAKATLEKTLGGWKAAGTAASFAKPPSAPTGGDKLRVYLVNRPDAVQTMIRFQMPGIAAQDERRVTCQLLNVIFGGSFTSRINQNLRERNGYTYGARSRFEMGASAGSVMATAAVKADVTGAALKEFLGELARTRKGDISADEATKAVQTFRADTVESFATLQGLLGVYSSAITNGLPLDTVGKDMAAAGGVKAEALNASAARALPLDQGVLVLVGDKKLILEQIKGLGLADPIEVDPTGKPVKP